MGVRAWRSKGSACCGSSCGGKGDSVQFRAESRSAEAWGRGIQGGRGSTYTRVGNIAVFERVGRLRNSVGARAEVNFLVSVNLYSESQRC